MMTTAISTVAGGVIGAVIKLFAGMVTLWLENKQQERYERISLIGKQIDVLKLRPDPSSSYTSHTRRVLAWGMCFTFCAICVLWAVFPHAAITVPDLGGNAGWGINLFLFHIQRDARLAAEVTTGAIVWSLLPFISMILMTYFTPDVSKIR